MCGHSWNTVCVWAPRLCPRHPRSPPRALAAPRACQHNTLLPARLARRSASLLLARPPPPTIHPTLRHPTQPQNSTEQLDRLEKAFDEVKARLLAQVRPPLAACRAAPLACGRPAAGAAIITSQGCMHVPLLLAGTGPCPCEPCIARRCWPLSFHPPAHRPPRPLHSNPPFATAQLHDKVRQQIFKGELYADAAKPAPAAQAQAQNGSSAGGSKGEAVENDWREHLVPATASAPHHQQQQQGVAGSSSGGSSGSNGGESTAAGGAQSLASSMPHIPAETFSTGSVASVDSP